MGFDQYHEPAEELSAETRTFARLCASLTEEAEAIGWYEQRIAVETDGEARAIMRDAQGEEFKHFCMDLEFLLRRTPLWREIAAGDPLPGGRHRRARRGGRGGGDRGRGRARRSARRRRVARHRRPAGERLMSHLLREHAPITEARLGRCSTTRRASGSRPPSRRASSSTSPARTAGSTRRRTSAARREIADRPAEGVDAAQRRVLPLVELRAPFSIARSELADADRGAEDADLEPLDEAAHRIAVAENAAVFHGWKAAGITGIAEASPHEPIELGEDCERYPAPRRQGGGGAARAPASTGPTGSRSAPRPYTGVLETSEHGGYPLLEHLREIVGGPLVWSPGVEGAACSACAAATSSSSPARTSRSATRATTPTRCGSTSRRASASASPLPRPRSRSARRGLSQLWASRQSSRSVSARIVTICSWPETFERKKFSRAPLTCLSPVFTATPRETRILTW